MALKEPDENNNLSKLDEEILDLEERLKALGVESQFEYYRIKNTIEKLSRKQAQQIALKFLGLYLEQKSVSAKLFKGIPH